MSTAFPSAKFVLPHSAIIDYVAGALLRLDFAGLLCAATGERVIETIQTGSVSVGDAFTTPNEASWRVTAVFADNTVTMESDRGCCWSRIENDRIKIERLLATDVPAVEDEIEEIAPRETKKARKRHKKLQSKKTFKHTQRGFGKNIGAKLLRTASVVEDEELLPEDYAANTSNVFVDEEDTARLRIRPETAVKVKVFGKNKFVEQYPSDKPRAGSTGISAEFADKISAIFAEARKPARFATNWPNVVNTYCGRGHFSGHSQKDSSGYSENAPITHDRIDKFYEERAWAKIQKAAAYRFRPPEKIRTITFRPRCEHGLFSHYGVEGVDGRMRSEFCTACNPVPICAKHFLKTPNKQPRRTRPDWQVSLGPHASTEIHTKWLFLFLDGKDNCADCNYRSQSPAGFVERPVSKWDLRVPTSCVVKSPNEKSDSARRVSQKSLELAMSNDRMFEQYMTPKLFCEVCCRWYGPQDHDFSHTSRAVKYFAPSAPQYNYDLRFEYSVDELGQAGFLYQQKKVHTTRRADSGITMADIRYHLRRLFPRWLYIVRDMDLMHRTILRCYQYVQLEWSPQVIADFEGLGYSTEHVYKSISAVINLGRKPQDALSDGEDIRQQALAPRQETLAERLVREYVMQEIAAPRAEKSPQ